MRPRIGYKKLAAVGVAAVVGVASTIALTSGSASASPVFGYISVNALVIDVYSLNTKVIVGHSAAGVIS